MIKRLNPILHSELRLAIMSHLLSVGDSDFVKIKEITEAASGNVSIQIKKLQTVGYISVTKGYKNNYHHTKVSITSLGIAEFEKYIESLSQYLKR
ncbi:MAG: transcriptional regulator [Bacteroidetes bacterium]|jgi:predicted transcriptional regulator|nr:transcriptional regulator [Bacteroidota bacterium]MBT3751336.1 transcriptional regulator [Bacteroidota bacterium]MBT4400137.1 transcriptional regulator [Bacteroidota bacterium]MBT4411189.1 transcriptional regulator [Bacteroidota bacterium]MBT7091708.1 transcriptional regulator [Bacteroidota bacterium]